MIKFFYLYIYGFHYYPYVTITHMLRTLFKSTKLQTHVASSYSQLSLSFPQALKLGIIFHFSNLAYLIQTSLSRILGIINDSFLFYSNCPCPLVPQPYLPYSMCYTFNFIMLKFLTLKSCVYERTWKNGSSRM